MEPNYLTQTSRGIMLREHEVVTAGKDGDSGGFSARIAGSSIAPLCLLWLNSMAVDRVFRCNRGVYRSSGLSSGRGQTFFCFAGLGVAVRCNKLPSLRKQSFY